MDQPSPLASSFRDPAGFVFQLDGVLYRQVNRLYQEPFDHLMASGLYDQLVGQGLMIPFDQADPALAAGPQAYKVLRPQAVGFISYPYEWSFSQLKDAALTTLAVQAQALEQGMSLKDASAYNIQFVAGQPRFIDHLSFEMYQPGQPWVAYRQFCQHFLAPLALSALSDVRLSQLMRIYLDGVPLDLASRLLPLSSRFRFPLLAHIHLHARSQARHSQGPVDTGGRQVSLGALKGILASLKSGVEKLSWQPAGTEWGEYYHDTNYSPQALEEKKGLVASFIAQVQPESLWDLGGNVGLFSRIASQAGIPTVCFDIDPAAVEKNYLDCRAQAETNLLPLLLDLTNPSPSLGWAHGERDSLARRAPAGLVMGLALIHHLAISNNLPLGAIARYLARLGPWLIMEWVPKEDSQVQRLLATREDIFPDYTQAGFERQFAESYRLVRQEPIPDTRRTLYLMQVK